MRQGGWTTIAIAAALCGALAGCGGGDGGDAADGEADTADRAAELAHDVLIADTHIDVPYRLRETPDDVGERTETGDFDWPRAREGGLDLAFMSIYIPASYQDEGDPGEVADGLIDMVEGIAAAHPDKFALVAEIEDAEAARAAGKVGLAMGMENGAPIRTFDDLRHYFDRGVRYVTLTHSKNNHICDSSYEDEDRWTGLSPFGRELVAEMNRVGMMIDVSHVSDEAFDQVLELSQAPVIATHSSCRHFTPDFERNLDDERIRRLGAAGGVIQINFGSAFLLGSAQKQSSAFWAARSAFREENGIEGDDPRLEQFTTDYFAETPRIYADVTDVADHIDHVVELVGVDHVGLGSDFDGVGDSLPTGLKDVSQYPNLIAELLRRGYSDDDVRKICSGNLFRVWSEVRRVAASAS